MAARIPKSLLLILLLASHAPMPALAGSEASYTSTSPVGTTANASMSEHPPVPAPTPPHDETRASVHVGGSTLETGQVVLGVMMLLAVLAMML
jgi:hypothetical protein